MNTLNRGLHQLRGLRRGYKLASVLLAAWAPLLLARSPWLAIAVMGGCTALFYCSTARRAEDTAPISREADDVEP